MKFNPRYLYFLFIPLFLILGLVLFFRLVNFNLNTAMSILRSTYSNNSTKVSEQSTQTITVPSYDEINIVGSMDVDLVQGKEGVITVTAPSNTLQYIKVESQNNTLQIYSDQWKYFGFIFQFGNNDRTIVTVPFESLNRIKITGSGKVTSKIPIVSDKLIVNTSGSGDMDLNVLTNDLESNTSGSGNIKLQGKTNNFVAQVFGSGTVSAIELEAQNAKVNTSGSGDIKLWAIQSLKASTFGSGNITYKGNPVANDIKISGSGEIKKSE
jgi:Putative auto-transporter adhesin, head GIN domain